MIMIMPLFINIPLDIFKQEQNGQHYVQGVLARTVFMWIQFVPSSSIENEPALIGSVDGLTVNRLKTIS